MLYTYQADQIYRATINLKSIILFFEWNSLDRREKIEYRMLVVTWKKYLKLYNAAFVKGASTNLLFNSDNLALLVDV